jgi:hypothetical protein
MPKVKLFAYNRSPTIDEIRKLVEFNDQMIKPLVYLMSSSGIRLGALDYIKWKHIIPITDEGDHSKVIVAKMMSGNCTLSEWLNF